MFNSMTNTKTQDIPEPVSVFADVFKSKQCDLKPKLSVLPTFTEFKPDGVVFKLVVPIK